MVNGEKIYMSLKNEMKKQKINQSQMALKLGVSRSNISIIFSRMKKNKVSYKNIIKMAKVLEISLKNFF